MSEHPAPSAPVAPGQSGLLAFVANTVGEGPLRVEESLGDGFVRLRVSEAERRQAKHDIRCAEDIVVELLRNARDAGARAVWLATSREGGMRTLTCVDDGCGIPAAMQGKVFEARVTSKLDSMRMDRWGVHGRGMALFSIEQNARAARVCASGSGLGCALSVEVDCSCLPERADQSTWPQVGRDEEGAPCIVRGPHNIVRTAAEFALDCGRRCAAFIGTPTEILASLVERGAPQVAARGMHPSEELSAAPVWLRPALAPDARSLAACAAELGLEVSERTCYRIQNGEIPCPAPLYEQLVPARGAASPVDLMRDRRGLKVAPPDLEDFSRSLRRAFNTLADRYYLELSDEPRIRVTPNAVTVTFAFDKEQ